NALEDLGYEAFDNLPLSLVGRLVDLEAGLENAIAISVDFRTRDFAAETFHTIIERLATRPGTKALVLFLDCDNEVLGRRFTETRRRHPLAEDRPVMDGIQHERRLLQPIMDRADLVIDTSLLSAGDLKRLLAGHFRLDQDPG